MDKVVPLPDMINTKVFFISGDQAGTIDELVLDPAAGIVRFANIRTGKDKSILMPWAAMLFTKSRGGFVLTEKGELILRGTETD